MTRVLALLTRSGLVTVDFENSFQVTLHYERLGKHKNRSQKLRGRISRKERVRLLKENDYQCGHCGHRLPPKELEIDHIGPEAVRPLEVTQQRNRERL